MERPLSSAPRQAATCKCTHSGTSSIPPPGKRHSRWDRGGSRAVWHCQQELGPAIRDRISALKLFYTFSLAPAAAQASSSCLSLRVNTSSGELLSPHCWQVLGSARKCSEVCVRQSWNQSSSRAISSIKMNSFVQKPWPGPVVGHRTGLLALRTKVSPAGAACCYQGFNPKTWI